MHLQHHLRYSEYLHTMDILFHKQYLVKYIYPIRDVLNKDFIG